MRDRTVGEMMTGEVVRGYRTTPLDRVARLLTARRISGLPVVDRDDKVIGVISHSDLTAHLDSRPAPCFVPAGPQGGPPGGAARASGTRGEQSAGCSPPGSCGRGRLDLPGAGADGAVRPGRRPRTGDLMTTPAVTVHPEQGVARAARIMEARGVSRLPVVDEEDRLIGIVTRRDLLRVFLRDDGAIGDEVTRRIGDGTRAPGGAPVEVVVRDGVVTLRGQTPTSADMGAAIRSAWRVEGVIGVVNQLTTPAERPARQEVPG
ncbi:CBS domain-containing protein [Streptomyces sp. NPDC020983]|uniref:CBS domain-containing protein n=1 Tax=Streptomyces sp. NPDC020983 TaxID=3365106 RepID=UPI00378B45A9